MTLPWSGFGPAGWAWLRTAAAAPGSTANISSAAGTAFAAGIPNSRSMGNLESRDGFFKKIIIHFPLSRTKVISIFVQVRAHFRFSFPSFISTVHLFQVGNSIVEKDSTELHVE